MTFALRQARRQKAIRHLHNALTAEATEAWVGASTVLAKTLTDEELAMLAVAALKALPADIALIAAQGAIEGEGMPLPLIDDKAGRQAEAEMWASTANQSEIRAVVWAGIRRMPPGVLSRLRAWLQGSKRDAAA